MGDLLIFRFLRLLGRWAICSSSRGPGPGRWAICSSSDFSDSLEDGRFAHLPGALGLEDGRFAHLPISPTPWKMGDLLIFQGPWAWKTGDLLIFRFLRLLGRWAICSSSRGPGPGR